MPGNIFGGVDAEHDIVGRGHARLSRCGLQSCLIGGFAPSSASSLLRVIPHGAWRHQPGQRVSTAAGLNRRGPADRRSRRTSWPWNYYSRLPLFPRSWQEAAMNGLIYLIGLIVVILAILSFFGLR